MYKGSKSEISRNFEPLIDHGPHWINLTFISEKKILNVDIKLGRNYFLLTWKKKKNLKLIIIYEEKGEFGALRVKIYVSKGIPQPCSEPIVKS